MKVYYARKPRRAPAEAGRPLRMDEDKGYLVRFGVPSRQARRKGKRRKTKEALSKNGMDSLL